MPVRSCGRIVGWAWPLLVLSLAVLQPVVVQADVCDPTPQASAAWNVSLVAQHGAGPAHNRLFLPDESYTLALEAHEVSSGQALDVAGLQVALLAGPGQLQGAKSCGTGIPYADATPPVWAAPAPRALSTSGPHIVQLRVFATVNGSAYRALFNLTFDCGCAARDGGGQCTQCTPCEVACPAGEGLSGSDICEGEDVSNAYCQTCGTGFFKATSDGAACQRCGTCGAGTTAIRDCTARQNALCVSTSERDAMLALRQSLLDASVWSDDNYCAWTGVTCSQPTPPLARVQDIILPGPLASTPGVATGLPAALANLPALETLTAVAAHLTGPFPPALAAISTLRELDLSQNQLNSSLADPALVTLLPQLRVLKLGNNHLTGQLSTAWLSEAAPSLTTLELHNNRLRGFLVSSPGPSTDELQGSALQALRVDGNMLFGPLPPLIAIPALSSLQLNQGSGFGFDCPPLTGFAPFSCSTCGVPAARPLTDTTADLPAAVARSSGEEIPVACLPDHLTLQGNSTFYLTCVSPNDSTQTPVEQNASYVCTDSTNTAACACHPVRAINITHYLLLVNVSLAQATAAQDDLQALVATDVLQGLARHVWLTLEAVRPPATLATQAPTITEARRRSGTAVEPSTPATLCMLTVLIDTIGSGSPNFRAATLDDRLTTLPWAELLTLLQGVDGLEGLQTVTLTSSSPPTAPATTPAMASPTPGAARSRDTDDQNDTKVMGFTVAVVLATLAFYAALFAIGHVRGVSYRYQYRRQFADDDPTNKNTIQLAGPISEHQSDHSEDGPLGVSQIANDMASVVIQPMAERPGSEHVNLSGGPISISNPPSRSNTWGSDQRRATGASVELAGGRSRTHTNASAV
ncbi:uncharacterized protein MONBRDRAFT_29554 [Monosiga brevicollis MX1]|uniref:TNFR-Cys domain-containing protein n=1 Tax=Monosiga brevicollis TaxID=81824 RepID=A9VBF5_MONBE|nr:uncharacterized protein MONBRDRAFT_29554 [Monosiga brevicollis MX1]EDQ85229.1 predicted protein [Monosiga brevicollis MX1]|eukprot:XP_001750054.1 hypothetical protein [Monosiga brevicollis MX1]